MPERECDILYSHVLDCRNICLVPGKCISECTVFTVKNNARGVHAVTRLTKATKTSLNENSKIHNLDILSKLRYRIMIYERVGTTSMECGSTKYFI